MLLCDALEFVLTRVIVHGLNTFRRAQNISACVIHVPWQNNRRDEQRGYINQTQLALSFDSDVPARGDLGGHHGRHGPRMH